MSELNAAGATLVARAKAILLTPKTEWPVIAAEPNDPAGLFTRYAIPLAAIGPVCNFIHGQVFGYGAFGITWRPNLLGGLGTMLGTFVLSLAGLFVFSLLIDFLAPRFGGQANRAAALKLAVYGATAGFVAGAFNLLPGLGILGILGLYGIYLFYTGAGPLMQVPQDKTMSFTVVTIIAAAVLALVVGAVVGPVLHLFGGTGIEAPAGDGEVGGKLSLPGGAAVDLDKMKAATAQMEQAANGKKPPVPAAQLQALLPAAIGSYKRTASDTTGVGAMGSSAEGTYTAGDNTFRLKITDMAALGALAGMGAAMGVEDSHEDADGYDRTTTVDGHLQSEAWHKSSHSGKFSVMVGSRFAVEAEGSAASVDELKAAVAAVDQGRLAALGS